MRPHGWTSSHCRLGSLLVTSCRAQVLTNQDVQITYVRGLLATGRLYGASLCLAACTLLCSSTLRACMYAWLPRSKQAPAIGHVLAMLQVD